MPNRSIDPSESNIPCRNSWNSYAAGAKVARLHHSDVTGPRRTFQEAATADAQGFFQGFLAPPIPSSSSSPAETRQCFVLSLAEFNYKEEAETLRPAVHRIGQKIEATLPLCFLLLCRLLSPFQPTLKFPLLNLPPPPSIPKMDSHLPSIPEASRKHPGSIRDKKKKRTEKFSWRLENFHKQKTQQPKPRRKSQWETKRINLRAFAYICMSLAAPLELRH